MQTLTNLYIKQNKSDEAAACCKELFGMVSTPQEKAWPVLFLVTHYFAEKNYSEVWRYVENATIVDCVYMRELVWRIIGTMYQKGLGVAPNKERAYGYFKKVLKYYEDMRTTRALTHEEKSDESEIIRRLIGCVPARHESADQETAASTQAMASSSDLLFFNDAYFKETKVTVDELQELGETPVGGHKRKEHPEDDDMEQGPAKWPRLEEMGYVSLAPTPPRSVVQMIMEEALD